MTFLDSLQHAGIAHRRSSGDPQEIAVNCPWCPSRGKPPDTRFKLGINSRTGQAHCFVCGWGSKRYGPVAYLRRMKVARAVGFEAEDAPDLPPLELPKDFQPLDRPMDDMDRMAHRYLVDRGVTAGQIERHGIGCSFGGRYAYRIIFPIWWENALKMLVCRTFAGGEPRYLNSRGDKWLDGFDPAAETVVLSEGVFKALRIATATGLGSAALLGHNITDVQLDQLRSGKCRRVILWPDPDMAGRTGVVKIAERLLDCWDGEVQVVWPVAQPADEMPLTDIAAAVNTARPYGWRVAGELGLKIPLHSGIG